MNPSFLKNCLIAALTLGTTWAVRGQFGHEQGAAWAGAVGALCILALARREDWNAKFLKVTLAAAIGWGLGGMMSYGIVVGYGRGIDFVNVYYGLTMLFVIGGLYGFIGGGLFGLTLSASEEQPVDWMGMMAKMVAGAAVIYFFIIAQWGWTMTPPRSELWAACLGMALVLGWELIRTERWSALTVAVYSGLGAGFGFGFGNFLQVLGQHSGVSFNFWNVMEYSLGFFGGFGMAYGTFVSTWPKTMVTPKWGGHLMAFLMLTLFIPYVVWKESFTAEKLERLAEQLDIRPITGEIQLLTLMLILLMTSIGGWALFRQRKQRFSPFTGMAVRRFFLTYFLWYIILSLLITGALMSTYRPEQYLYLLNFAVILPLVWSSRPVFEPQEINTIRWARLLLIVLGILGVAALVAMNINEPFEGMHRRFEF